MRKSIMGLVALVMLSIVSSSAFAATCDTPQLRNYRTSPVQSFLDNAGGSGYTLLAINLCAVESYALSHNGLVLYVSTATTLAVSTDTETSGIRGAQVIHLFGRDISRFVRDMQNLAARGT